jgi:hypothetical protein
LVAIEAIVGAATTKGLYISRLGSDDPMQSVEKNHLSLLAGGKLKSAKTWLSISTGFEQPPVWNPTKNVEQLFVRQALKLFVIMGC